MGGLVIKRAFILAKQRDNLRSLTDRIKAMVFLATPHRGADLASVFSKILNLTGGARPFVEDLHRNSLATESINEEFPFFCQDLRIISFYETLPTIGKSLIVERDQATLGYANERRQYLNANHREVCKYGSKTDENYCTVRNALAGILNDFQESSELSRQKTKEGKSRQLEALLAAYDTPEDDLLTADSVRMGGSCEWLTKKQSFLDWLACTGLQTYWVVGKPAAGKTVLAGKVITHLRKLDKSCSFHFFHYGNKAMSGIGSFLLSIARQMALLDDAVMDTVLDIFGRDRQISKADSKTIWRKLFLEGIFRIRSQKTQYWVIDALDECANENEITLLLTKLMESTSIRVLTTSRNAFESCVGPVMPPARAISEHIQEEDSKYDIRLYLEASVSSLPAIDADGKQHISEQILEKSAGCFLWVNLVIQELANARTTTDIAKVLKEVPTDMNDLYARIFDKMSGASYGKRLSQAILVWITCSVRPLKTTELHDALQVDLNEKVDNDIAATIRSCCGQVVHVDTQSQVQLVHLTLRDFLLGPKLESEFAVKEATGHRRLLLTCLAYLNSDEMRGLRRRGPGGNQHSKNRSDFCSYASNAMFEHISSLQSIDTEIVSALARFFGSANVITWIEYIARHSDIHRLLQTGKALDKLVQQQKDPNLARNTNMMLLRSWAIDLVQLVMKFGKSLAASPSAIVDLIPPFCPPASALWKQFGCKARGLKVCGLRAQVWDDCLSTVVNPHEQFSSLACSSSLFAIGTFRGKILMYNQTTCQEIGTLKQEEPVRMLSFGSVNQLLVSTGFKHIYVWNIDTRRQLWKLEAPQQTMSMTLTNNDQTLMGALKDHRLKSWDLKTGTLFANLDWTEGLEEMTKLLYRRPTTAAFGMDAHLLAVIYKGQDILLWDLESDSLYDTYNRERGVDGFVGRPYGSSGVRCLCFGAADSADLLCAAYTDGELVLFDTATGLVTSRITAFAHILVSSPDGSTLASADPSGIIQLFHLQTLELIYVIKSVEPGLQGLTFSSDSSRLLDIRTSRCRVWEPNVLQGRRVYNDFAPSTTSYETAPEIVRLDAPDECIQITSMTLHDGSTWIFGGKEDGSVHLYDSKAEMRSIPLYSHAHGVVITSLDYDAESHSLASIDSSSRIMIHRVKQDGQSLSIGNSVFDHRADLAVGQLILRRGLGQILICSGRSDVLWSISDGQASLQTSIEYDDREPYRWSSHPTNADQLILIASNMAHIFSWDSLERLTNVRGILLEGSIVPELIIRSIQPCFGGSMLATTFSESLHSESKLLLWNTSEFGITMEKASPVPDYHQLADYVEVLIGNTENTAQASQTQRLIFLHRDNWVCSTDHALSRANQYIRHFFFPSDWLSANVDSVIKVAAQGDIIIVKKDEIAVILRGLQMRESVEFDTK